MVDSSRHCFNVHSRSRVHVLPIVGRRYFSGCIYAALESGPASSAPDFVDNHLPPVIVIVTDAIVRQLTSAREAVCVAVPAYLPSKAVDSDCTCPDEVGAGGTGVHALRTTKTLREPRNPITVLSELVRAGNVRYHSTAT